jgi:hypothetical protein
MPACRSRLICSAGLVLMLVALALSPARADFFDGMRRTFESDIPHFFQDDIPCAFGGRPTSHTRTTCPSGAHAPRSPAAKPVPAPTYVPPPEGQRPPAAQPALPPIKT